MGKIKKEKKRSLGLYEIEYANNIKQHKTLISKEDYELILRPIEKIITTIKDDNGGKSNKQTELLKESLKEIFGNYDPYFVVGSPLYAAMKTGTLSLPPQQGGEHYCKIKKINL